MKRGLYRKILIVAVVLGANFFLTQSAEAVAPTIELANPTPNSVQYLNTQMLFEVRINTGDEGDYTIEWEPLWDGTTETFSPDPAGTQTFHIATFPATGVQYPELRYQKTITGIPVGAKFVRTRVSFGGDQVLASGRYSVIDMLSFSGYTWTGASTSICVGADGLPDGLFCSTDSDCPEGDTCGRDAFGWTSFSCANENLVCGTVKSYGVRVGTITGGGTPNATLLDRAWVGEASGTPALPTGWMTFNRKYCSYVNPAESDPDGAYCVDNSNCPDSGNGAGICTPLGAPPIPEGEDWAAQPTASYVYSSVYDLGDGQKRYPDQVSGWARLLTLKKYGEDQTPPQADWGWVHLRGPEAPKNICVGGGNDGKSCAIPADCPGGACVAFSNSYTNLATAGYHQCSDCSVNKNKCGICQKVQQNPGDAEADWKNFACNSCYECDSSGNCNTCEKCDSYGVSYDAQRGRLVGFAWAGGQDQSGLGWTQFDPSKGGIGVLQAWLATRYGDIFAGGPIAKSPMNALPSPPGTFNATYVIQANGTIEFTSQAGYLQPDYPSEIELPSSGNQYFNVLGRIDMQTMTVIGENRYGETIEVSGDLNAYLNALPDGLLNGKIYYHAGNAVINTAIEFQPGIAGSLSGAGTIIVDGDLTINAPITYESQQQVGRVVNLPSVAWIVRGNVSINPNLGAVPGTTTDPSIVGAYLVVGYPSGEGNTVPCAEKAPDHNDIKGGGIVSTGASSSLQLIANGLMMARCFNFERTVGAQEGSEQIIYDGRLLANPPPGLQDLTAVLPIIREVTPYEAP